MKHFSSSNIKWMSKMSVEIFGGPPLMVTHQIHQSSTYYREKNKPQGNSNFTTLSPLARYFSLALI